MAIKDSNVSSRILEQGPDPQPPTGLSYAQTSETTSPWSNISLFFS